MGEKTLTHASVFSGIGGPELAATMLGWKNLFHCDINDFGRSVLDYYYFNSESYEDIKETDFSKWRGKVDVLTGGFPCQPFSYAGKRRGSEDDRYLWPYMLRCIEQVRPTWFIDENVAGITTMVFPGKESKMGEQADLFGEGDQIYERRERYVIDEICSNLERIGYSVQPFIIPACSVGAPHRRDRVFIVAHDADILWNTDSTIGNEGKKQEMAGRSERTDTTRVCDTSCRGQLSRSVADTEYERPVQCEQQGRTRFGEGLSATSGNRLCDAERPTPDTACSGSGTQGTCAETACNRCDGLLQQGERGSSAKRADGLSQIQGTSSDSTGKQGRGCGSQQREACEPPQVESGRGSCEDCCEGGTSSNTDDAGFQETRTEQQAAVPTGEDSRYMSTGIRWRAFPTVSPVYRGDDGLQPLLDHIAIHEEKNRVDGIGLILEYVSDGTIDVDAETGKVYSKRIKGGSGEITELKHSECSGNIVYDISKNGIKKRFRACDIVWISQNGAFDGFTQMVAHRNGDKSDNRIENLELVTIQHADEAKNIEFDEDDIRTIQELFYDGNMSTTEISSIYECGIESVIGALSRFPYLSIPFGKWKTESLKAYGNAIVPQVMYEIFRAIEIAESHD